ncbi:MAG: glycosyltransferase, partial [Anaerolineae bacterium]
HVGGVEAHLLSLLRYGDRTRYHWLIVSLVSPAFQTQVEALGAQVFPWQAAHQLDIAALARLVRLFRSHHVGLVHAHSPRAALLGRVAARLLGIPVVVTVHLPPYKYVHGQGLRARFQRWLYRRAEQFLNHALTDRLIYVSSRIGREAINRGLAPFRRTTIIENGIDLSPFADCYRGHSVREELGTSPATTVLCCVGRLTEQKGMDILLEALHGLEPRKWDLRLWLIGDGPQRSMLETRARQLGLETRVQFLGWRYDVPDLLVASDIFVLPSRYEAMPMTILEAMAAGLPCVVTDVGDNALLVEDGVNGRVVSPEDPAALAGALRDLIQSPGARRVMGDAARRKAQHYSVERMVACTLAVYGQVTGCAANGASDNKDVPGENVGTVSGAGQPLGCFALTGPQSQESG